MKRGTPEHPKMLALMRALKVPKYAAVGILECVWHFAARYAPQGNIGKYSDQEIADAAGWTGDAGKLVEALFVCRWLDKSGQWRICVHDWGDHLEDATAKYLKRNRLEPIAGDAVAVAVAVASAKAIAIAIAKAEAEMSRNVSKCPDTQSNCGCEVELHGNQGTRQVEEVYKAYPHHVKPDAAKAEIVRALKRVPFAKLLAKVKEFAASPAGHAGQWVQDPDNWFRDGRWNDDPAEWQRVRETGGRPIGTTIAQLEARAAADPHHNDPQEEGSTF